MHEVLRALESADGEAAESLEVPVGAFVALSRRVQRAGTHDLHSAERERLLRVARLLRVVPRISLLPPVAPRPIDVHSAVLDLRLVPGTLLLQLSQWTAFYIRGLDAVAPGLRSLHLDACSLHRLRWITKPGCCASTEEAPSSLPADQRPIFSSMQSAAQRDRSRRLAAAPDSVAWPHLRSLRARDCGLVDLHDALASVPALESLDVSFNGLASLDGLPALPTLSALTASANPLSRVPEPVLCLDALRTLRLARCGLRSAGPFRHCFSVQYLDLSFNEFPDLGCLLPLAGLHNLRSLCVYGAPLRCPRAALEAAAAVRRAAAGGDREDSRQSRGGEAAAAATAAGGGERAGRVTGDAAVAAAREAADCSLVPPHRRLTAPHRAPLLAALLARVLSPSAPLRLDGLTTLQAERAAAAAAAAHVRSALTAGSAPQCDARARQGRSLFLRTAVRARCMVRWAPGRDETSASAVGNRAREEEEEGAEGGGAAGAVATGVLSATDPSTPRQQELARSCLVWRRQPEGAVRGELEVVTGAAGGKDRAGSDERRRAASRTVGWWRETLYMSDRRVSVDFPLSALVGVGPAAPVQRCTGVVARADPAPGTVDLAAVLCTDMPPRGDPASREDRAILVVFTAPEEPGRRLLRLLAPIAAQGCSAWRECLLPEEAQARGKHEQPAPTARDESPVAASVAPTALREEVGEAEEDEEVDERGSARPATPEGSPSARVSVRAHPTLAAPPGDAPSACVYDADALARALAAAGQEGGGGGGDRARAGLTHPNRPHAVWPRVLWPVHIPRRLAPLPRARHAEMYLRECVFPGSWAAAGSGRGGDGPSWQNEPVCAVFEVGVTLWMHPGGGRPGAGAGARPAHSPPPVAPPSDRAARSASTSAPPPRQQRRAGAGRAGASPARGGARCASVHIPHFPELALRVTSAVESPPRQEVTRDPRSQTGLDPRTTLAQAAASTSVAALRPATAHREPQAVVAVTGAWLLILRWEPGAGKALESKPGLEVVLAARCALARSGSVPAVQQRAPLTPPTPAVTRAGWSVCARASWPRATSSWRWRWPPSGKSICP